MADNTDGLLIYGANGYTGMLIAHEAVARGQRPVLAGRNAQEVSKLAGELGLEYRVFGLDDPEQIALQVGPTELRFAVVVFQVGAETVAA